MSERCGVGKCKVAASYEVILYKVYLYPCQDATVFWERDYTCPFLCQKHMEENVRKTKRHDPVNWPYEEKTPHTNRHMGNFITLYRPLPVPPRDEEE